MSYQTVISEVTTPRLATVTGLAAVLDYEPMTVQAFPTAYQTFEGATREYVGNHVRVTYRIVVTLVFRWADREAAEADLGPFVNSVAAALDFDNIYDGAVSVPELSGDYRMIGGTTYRVVDLIVEVVENLALGEG